MGCFLLNIAKLAAIFLPLSMTRLLCGKFDDWLVEALALHFAVYMHYAPPLQVVALVQCVAFRQPLNPGFVLAIDGAKRPP
jgi:hypothetical protein